MILVLTDLTQMTLDKVQATINLIDEVRKDDIVVYPSGLINNIAFQKLTDEYVNLLLTSKNHWEANTANQIKSKFSDFTEKFIISTSEDVHKALVLEFNLEGRNDFKSIKFKNEDNFENFRIALMDLKKSSNQLLSLVSDLKLMVSSIFSALPAEIQTTVNNKYAIAKSILENSMQISADFVSFISSVPPQLKSRKVILEDYFKKSTLTKSIDIKAFFQIWEKTLSEDETRSFSKYIEEKVIPASLASDQYLMTALASISSAISKE